MADTRPALVVDGQTNADAAYMNNEIIASIGDLLKLRKELGDGSKESIVDILNKFAKQGFFNLLVNSDFTNWSGGSLRYWTAFASSIAQVTTSTDNSLGHDFARVTTDGSGANSGIKQTTAENSLLSVLLPRVKAQQLPMTLKVKVRSSTPLYVALNDVAKQTQGTGAWEEVVVRKSFTGTESDISVQIYVPGTANTTAVSFDVGEAVLVVGEAEPLQIATALSVNVEPSRNTIPVADTNGILHKGFTPYFMGFKNRIINGDFSVWQRGTSFTFGAGTTNYTADRFISSNNTDGQFTVSKSTLNGKNALKITVNTPPTDLTLGKYWHGFMYKFEGQHLYDLAIDGKNITISFWFNSNVSGEYSVALINETYYGQTGTFDITKFDSYVTTFNYTTPNTPQKIVITIPFNHAWTTQPVNDNKLGFVLVIAFLNQGDFVTSTINQWLSGQFKLTTSTAVNWGAAAGNFIEIAEIQLEEGGATDFEVIPYDIQLLRCMRYYEKASNPSEMAHGRLVMVGLLRNFPYIPFKIQKRTRPTIKIYSYNGTPNKVSYITGSSELSGTWTVQLVSPYGFANASSSDTTDSAGTIFWFKWEADAEL